MSGLLPLDGPAVYGNKTITDTASEVKVGSNVLEERSIVTIQPLDGVVYFGYDSSVTTSSGTKIFKGQTYTLEAGESLPVWVIAETGESIDVRITEVS